MKALNKVSPAVILLVIMLQLAGISASSQETLTISDVRQRALEFNRQYLSAQEDVAIARGDIKNAWADALPSIDFSGNYNRTFEIPKVFFIANGETMELQTGFKNSFGANVSVQQPIWHGGKVFTALHIAELYEEYSEAISKQVEAEVVFTAEQLFYGAILARAQLAVFKKAYESNSANLDVVEKQYSQGVVSEYEVLRARVEKQNLQPQLIKAEADVKLAEKRLKSFLGIDLKAPVTLMEDQTDTSMASVPGIADLTAEAVERRPEMVQANTLTDITDRAIRVAQADYYPNFDAVGNYNWQSASDDFTLSQNESKSWTAGLTITWSLFSGGRTRAAVNQSRAENKKAELNRKQVQDDVALEVEEAYTSLIQAKQSLDIQGATIAAAEEGLKIAQVRYESGVGTQLEVLSAQTALTDARTALAQAMYTFRIARAGLKKATTQDI